MKSILTLFFCCLFAVAYSQTDVSVVTGNAPINTDSVYEKPEIEAQFPGGDQKWNKFINDKIAENINRLVNDPKSTGTVLIRFIVDQDGNISGARAMSMENSELAKIALKAILKGPKWTPATINGIAVKSIRHQKISFKTK